ncbi:cyclic GMP-AMP synthase-like protein [Drosophila kikkawai]|uniref:Cyclic GMP-AMP synthase-like protein n=1 Tax=Drosophila kikkawai TaxID=30033 RepID=A0ABM3C8A2_DROKI|nr:uncharacterized protein LOC108071888 [Drosophila kikkawai]
MSFAGNLKHILSKLDFSDKDRVEYTKDAVEIQNFVVQQLQENDETFRRVFAGFSLGGSYLDRVKLVTPDEFDLHMKLKFPYEITPKRDEKGFVFLYAPNGYAPGVATDNYIHRDFLQNWLRGAFERVFSSSVRVRATYGVYTLKYTLAGYACAHTIEAVSGNREISFDLVPAFEFDSSLFPFYIPPFIKNGSSQYPWFAVPQKKSGSNDERTFIVCAPHWEREMMKNSYNFKNVLRLMKGLKDKAGRDSLPHLTSYMLKTVMLHKHNSVNWHQDEGTLLVEMWRSLVEHLRSGRLDFILAENHNIFDRMTYNERSTCFANAKEILNKLCNSYYRNNLQALSQLFP